MNCSFSKLTIVLLITVIFLPGCASIVSRTSNPVYIKTNPPGVNVAIIDRKGKEVFKGKTPTTATLRTGAGYFTKAEYQVKLTSPGFSEKIIPINYKINGWYFGNILIGGLIGMLIVDPATGAMWKIQDPVVDETMDREVLPTSSAPTLRIIDVKDLPANLKTGLVRIN